MSDVTSERSVESEGDTNDEEDKPCEEYEDEEDGEDVSQLVLDWKVSFSLLFAESI